MDAVEYEAALCRWYVRFTCDGRDATTIYFDLHQRTLRHEVFFLPAPDDPERRAELAVWVLQRNHGLYGTRFSMGPEGDLYLTGRLALEHLTEEELDILVARIALYPDELVALISAASLYPLQIVEAERFL